MREILTVIKANIRRGKGSFISILILTFFISLTLTAVLSVNRNSALRNTQAMDEAGFGDLFLMLENKKDGKNGVTPEAVTEQIKGTEGVEEADSIPIVYASIKKLNKKTSSNTLILMPYRPGQLNYRVFNKNASGLTEEQTNLKKGEILVPVTYQTLYNCRVGDRMYLKGDARRDGYRVAGFFEDPAMGGSMMGIKVVLFNESDIETLAASEDKHIGSGAFVNVTREKDKGLSSLKFEKQLNESTQISECLNYTLSRSQSQGYMLIMVNIFSGILGAFVALLLIVVLIVLGHSINTSIEMEYTNIGILKAVGFTAGKLKNALILQYLSAVLLGVLAGIPSALPIIRLVNRMTLPVTGLFVSDKIPLTACILALTAVVLVILLFVVIKVRKISHITPLKAIGGGKEDVYFRSRPELPISQRGLNSLLALRQLTSGRRQYISACLITMLLTFFLIMVSGMSSWIGDDGKNLTQLYNCFEAQIDVRYKDENLRPEVEKLIGQENEIADSFLVSTQYLHLNDCQIYAYVCDKPEKFSTVLEGRTCRYDNEILITQFVADDLGIGIGDKVTLSFESRREEYIVSGIYQCGNDMGTNFAMSMEGYRRLTGKAPQFTFVTYQMKNEEKLDHLIKEVRKKYTEDKLIISNLGEFSEIDSIVTAIHGISAVIYVIAAVFALTTVFMVCGKIFRREKKDYGIYKAMGFTSGALRLQFAVRFAVVAFIGAVLGIVMSVLLADQCLEGMLSYTGVSRLEDHVDLFSTVLPGMFLILLFFAASWWRAGRIRKIRPTVLIEE